MSSLLIRPDFPTTQQFLNRQSLHANLCELLEPSLGILKERNYRKRTPSPRPREQALGENSNETLDPFMSFGSTGHILENYAFSMSSLLIRPDFPTTQQFLLRQSLHANLCELLEPSLSILKERHYRKRMPSPRPRV
ncbi:hypothetical protein CDAR_480501 [Caerostris darwini]|uniref:Uncharacterized protein n=1 Tax=Caerostris darwini TaxID=1538125 RepID=A0AAV4V0H1_9ARAC|nr:hypothetical protein CDAR_480501 [Caerostris darwini]